MLNVALVGAGSFGRRHLEAYTTIAGAAVTWVCDPDESARLACQSTYGVPSGSADYTDALNDDSVDLVDIVAPNYLHKQLAIDAAAAGKHVLCEKPMALTSAECLEMVTAARAAGTQLHVKYHQRFERTHQRFKSMWESGELAGSVVTIARRMDSHLASMLDPHHWRGTPALTGGGCLFSSGSHTLDLLEYVFGPVAAVTAVNRQLLAGDPNKADDNATVVLEFAGGMVATFIGCWTVEHVKWTTMETYARDSTIRVRSDADSLVLEREAGGSVTPLLRSDRWFETSNHAAIAHFVSCVAGESEPYYLAEDCIRTMRTLEAAYRSSDSGQRVVLPSI